MAKRGRKSKFTPEIRDIIIEKVREGNFIDTARRFAGIGITTFKRWIELGESKAPEYAEFRAFRAAIARARAEAETTAVQTVQKADDWRAKAWFLEHSFRKWAPRAKDEQKGQQSAAEIPPVLRATMEVLANFPDARYAVADRLLSLPDGSNGQGGGRDGQS